MVKDELEPARLPSLSQPIVSLAWTLFANDTRGMDRDEVGTATARAAEDVWSQIQDIARTHLATGEPIYAHPPSSELDHRRRRHPDLQKIRQAPRRRSSQEQRLEDDGRGDLGSDDSNGE